MSIDYTDGKPRMKPEVEIPVGGEPWQVVIDGCGKTAYVVLRKDQKVVRIDNLDTTPTKGASVDVGSEPTGLALTPNNTKLYVSNWVDGTLSVIDPVTMAPIATIDLNQAIVATGKLGANVTSRVGLAHPRAIAITNNKDMFDFDESVLVTEWFSLRTDPESATGTEADANWQGLVYRVRVGNDSVSTIPLPSIKNTGFKDIKNQDTGCFPNQVASITIENDFAYVTSTCASPAGPLGVFIGGQCDQATVDTDCGLGGTCTAGKCEPNTRDVKTTTHPGMSIINLTTETVTTEVLDKRFEDKGSPRVPLLQSDLGFFNGFGYVSAMGADAVFRLIIKGGQIDDVGSPANIIINLRKDATDKDIRLPIGIATAHDSSHTFAFVNNEGQREVTALAFNSQAIAGDASMNDFRITPSASLPTPDSTEEHVLSGKRFFTTGLGRWSLDGAAWGACAACHLDGLSDNVTWYFARGPRQTTSLEGSFASKNPADQRIFNWTGIFDEVADFENNTRDLQGGLGAIVVDGATPGQEVRINIAGENPPQQGLQGSTRDVADPKGSSAHPHSKRNDWADIEAFIKTIRSPRKPHGLNKADVDAGKLLFGQSSGNCVGCHSGDKWTVSQRFYNPGDGPNAATADPAPASLGNKSWFTGVNLNGFPAALFPTTTPDLNGFMRVGAAPAAEQMLCAMRPVGTIALVGGVVQGVSPSEVNVIEVRQDMTTPAQGAADTSRGYNPPSLLGMAVGAPYFHAGNARTLEELFSALFVKHYQSPVASVFTPSETQVKQLVAYILSIDEDEPTVGIPNKGNTGGQLCF